MKFRIKGVGDFFALDIGTNALRLVQLTGAASTGWTLTKFAYAPIDPTIIQDSSDNGHRKLGEAVLAAMQQADIKTKNVAIGLPANKTYTTVIEVPNQPLDQLKKIVRYQADQHVPMAIDEAKVDFTVLGLSPNDPTKAEVLMASTAIAYAEEQMEIIEAMGLNIVAEEPAPLAMARALSPVGVPDARLIIDFGEASTDLVITYQGAPRLVRTIPGGLQLLVRTVSSALSVKEDQARQFILKFGLAQDKLEGQVFRALDSTLETFSTELTKSTRFFQTKYPTIKVGGIILSGFAGVIPFISEYIEAKTNVPTTQGNPWQLVRISPEQQQALSSVASEFAVAIGLAERSNE